ncbi:MAG: DUF4097 family beta strand repeat-containing protein [Vicinamibacterales bacterium]
MSLTARLSTAVLVTCLGAAPALAQKVEERVDRTLPFQSGGTVRLKTFSGKVEIRGTDGDQVVVHAVRRAEADKLRDVTFDIRTEGSSIVIDANHRDSGWRRNDNVVEADIELQVPRRTTLDVTTFSAPVTVRGVEGRHDIGGFSSTIRVEDAVQGLRVKTFSGDVIVAARSWPDGQDIDVNTFSGGIDLTVPPDARGSLAFNTFSGDLDSDLPIAVSRTRGRRNVEGTLNGGGSSSVRLKTFSGDARVRR